MARLRKQPAPVATAPTVDFAELRRRLRDYRRLTLVVVDQAHEDHPEVVERRRVAEELKRRHVGLRWYGQTERAVPDDELVAAVAAVEADLDRHGWLEAALRRHAEHEENRRQRGW